NIYKSRFPVKEAKPVVANFGYEEKRWRETLRVKRTGQDNSFPVAKVVFSRWREGLSFFQFFPSSQGSRGGVNKTIVENRWGQPHLGCVKSM
ncbi:MAG: hypothetical protein NZ954_08825, partial [Thermofilaceae archaeon]|nr:hypothetical protein [Thermofilaceae archaeon]